MNKEEIDKWLDEEYGCSYTQLEELNDFYFEKYTDQKEEIKELNKSIEKLLRENTKKGNIINELEKMIDNFDVFKEFTFPLMKRDEEQQVKSSIDYEWKKSIKEPFLNKIKELKEGK